MDPQEAADRLLQALADGGDIGPWIADDVHFRSDTEDILDKDRLVARLNERLEGPFRRFAPGQTTMKRNLVFAWWQIEGMDGKEEQGTWILGFDRDGHVVEWNEFRG